MAKILNDVVIEVATVNGSGSQSANNILLRSIFKMGIPVGGKNLFPSNIAGLPTWFTIRAHAKGYIGRRELADIFVAMNADTIVKDVTHLRSGGIFIYNSDLRFDATKLSPDCINVPVSFKELVSKVTDSIKLKKLLTNMVYIGILAELLKVEKSALEAAVKDQFKGKESIFEINFKAIDTGAEYAREHLKDLIVDYELSPLTLNQGKIIIDGNSASALGLLFGGCTFMSWYPITPSSSVAENFQSLCETYRVDHEGKKNYAMLQAEDELSAIAMVLGAGWAGARAVTTTSGPGVSLMNEAAGLFYFAEIPGVIWDVQRMGPSTGLPTRTAQGDILSAAFLSHGDTKQVFLLPGHVGECFEFGQVAMDLAERLQTLVLVLSDLDLGMNFWINDEFQYPTRDFDRGKVLSADALNQIENFYRYKDVDGDGIPYRTLPGTRSDKAAYFTRGSGHDEASRYSEDPKNHQDLLDRLNKKFNTAKKYVPGPVIDSSPSNKIGFIAFGSSDMAIPESRAILQTHGIHLNYLRLRAYPFTDEVYEFIKNQERVYVVEQNRDGQMRTLLTMEYPDQAMKLHSILHYNGLPISAESIVKTFLDKEGGK